VTNWWQEVEEVFGGAIKSARKGWSDCER